MSWYHREAPDEDMTYTPTSVYNELTTTVQTYYELLRQCQSELKAHGAIGMVETIETTLERN